MRKLVYLLAIIAFASCNQPSGFVINGTIEGAEGTVVLEKQTNRTWATLDSAQIVDGKFTFSGEVAFPETYYLSFGKRKKAMLFLENSEISVVGKVDSLRGVVVTGSKTHDEYNAFNSKLEEVSKSMMSKYREARKLQGEEKTEEAEKLMAEVDELYRQTMDMQRQFIRENPASFVAPFFLSKIFYDMDADTLEAYLNGFDEKLAVSPIIENFRERVTNLRKVAIGQKAPDFEMLDPDAKIVKVTSIYPANKYTLIDFWASWCGPCRQENPNVVAVYNDYKAKGFGVYGVSLDSKKEAWLKAIEDDKLDWPHVSDLKGWSNSAAKLYMVNSIPANVLVDQKGVIVARNIRGEELREKVAELLD